MEYEWDSEKKHSNIEKHAVDFQLVNDLDWDSVLEAQDDSREVQSYEQA